jgi:hypothetical protein
LRSNEAASDNILLGDVKVFDFSGNLVAETIWGLGRTIAVEGADLWGGQIDLDPAEDPAVAGKMMFLDALAHHRRATGKAALSVNWGTWAEAGMATQFRAREESKRRGRTGSTKGVGVFTHRTRAGSLGTVAGGWRRNRPA